MFRIHRGNVLIGFVARVDKRWRAVYIQRGTIIGTTGLGDYDDTSAAVAAVNAEADFWDYVRDVC